MQNTKTNYFK